MLQVIRVGDAPVVHVFSVCGNANFMHIGFTHQYSTGRAQPRGHSCVFRGRPCAEESGAHSGGIRHLVQFVFDRQRHALQQAARLTVLKPFG